MAYTISTGRGIGIQDLSSVYTAGNLGDPTTAGGQSGTTVLPSAILEGKLGEIVSATDPSAVTATTNGGAEFIFLAVPTSTTITAGLMYRWNAATYRVIVVPTSVASQALSGAPCALAVNAVTSNANSVQFTWFQIQGRGSVLKTAVTWSPDTAMYISGTAGRVTNVASAFKNYIGMRSANAATVTSTTSSVLVYLNRPNIAPGI